MNIKEMRAKHPISYKLEAKPMNGKTVVYLYGDIVDETPMNWWTGEPETGDFITPKGVRETLDAVESNEIELHINSYGGSVFASIAIKSYLEGLGKNITVYVDAIAASGGSIIAMAGNTIKMNPSAMLMIHRAWSVAMGNCSDFLKQAETLEKIDQSVLEAYVSKFKGDKAELSKMVNDETWLTADEAFELGLCDEVVREVKTEEPKNKYQKPVNMVASFIDAAFINSKNKGEK